ncbi:cysteine peptidase family C39 domain-containing protein [Shewanella sp. BJSY2023SW005]|uniref:cysteine peptidase family C39 domain-containing protein n=1 Tax=Shewanella sp. BJSY2023SW005 TaxID=3392043 RepID=UPI0039B36E75
MSSQFISGIHCLSLIARFHHIPADPNSLIREFKCSKANKETPSLANINLIRAARSLSLKAKFINDTPDKLSEHVLPAVGRHVDGHFFIIAKVSDDKVLVQDLSKSNSGLVTYSKSEINEIWTGELLLLSKRSSLLSGVMTDSAKFGFSWFVPALLKYRGYFSDVFIASFFIQLVGLASPIFFQVVIDKVLVHKGMVCHFCVRQGLGLKFVP